MSYVDEKEGPYDLMLGFRILRGVLREGDVGVDNQKLYPGVYRRMIEIGDIADNWKRNILESVEYWAENDVEGRPNGNPTKFERLRSNWREYLPIECQWCQWSAKYVTSNMDCYKTVM